MKKALLYATAVAFVLSLGGGLTASSAFAQTAAKEKKMTLAECKKLADPKAKDECVKKVNAAAKKEKTAKTAKTAKKEAPKK